MNTTEDQDETLMTIRRWKPRPRTEITLSYGVDPHYNIRIEIDPDSRDSHAADGIVRPSAGVWVGGVTPPETPPDDDKQEVTAWRSFNEDEFRWLAKACLAAAGALRRIESENRRKGIK